MPSSLSLKTECNVNLQRAFSGTRNTKPSRLQLVKNKTKAAASYPDCGDSKHMLGSNYERKQPYQIPVTRSLGGNYQRTQSSQIPLTKSIVQPQTRCQLPSRLNATTEFEEASTVDEEALQTFLDSLKFDSYGLLVAIAQHADTGSILMQAFASRAAVEDTLRRGKATFYSRSRQALWTKGETSHNFIQVSSVHVDCDRDSLIYLGLPLGPSCHTGADTCFYTRVDGAEGAASAGAPPASEPEAALATLFMLEDLIKGRAEAELIEGSKASWTRKLLDDPEMLCGKVREEADELARTWEDKEGPVAAASEMADVLYHSMVLLRKQGVPLVAVCEILRGRFGISGIDEKATRNK
eukprot:CAMPEP_0196592322 /NCGR_PEP_ID=MMETSP1081-20130531/72411_1 /TAXON_ID=36882 /ORGANISM="Pyramimonas amylifera, Strain CCMP720" /LENGTH=352 /DNA_ID=CAMNT_0041915969 /DNA_START=50 /DNA_END=1108 /DNA_ORIENTATION=+